MEHERTQLWRHLRSPGLAAFCERDAVVLPPVSSVEQHGPHLPVETVSPLAEKVSIRAAGLVAANHPVVVVPTVLPGLSEHHMGYVGTLSISFPTFAALLAAGTEAVADVLQNEFIIKNDPSNG